jgi:hypothetical protein
LFAFTFFTLILSYICTDTTTTPTPAPCLQHSPAAKRKTIVVCPDQQILQILDSSSYNVILCFSTHSVSFCSDKDIFNYFHFLQLLLVSMWLCLVQFSCQCFVHRYPLFHLLFLFKLLIRSDGIFEN